MSARRLHGVWLGRQRYASVHELQNEMQEARKRGQLADTALFVEHDPVITLGRGAAAGHVLASRERLHALGVDLVVTERGGDVTLHAPGQLVCYPIVDLSPDRCDVRRYIRDLTETMQRLAADFGVDSGTVEQYIGLWADRQSPAKWPGATLAQEPAKLGAIGVHLSRWVTKHGFALNLTTDLELFRLIVPCGITAHGVTSVQDLTGRSLRVESVVPRALTLLASVLGAETAGLEDRSRRSLPGVPAFST
jgi:lipoyl(octanoyl) transferase